MKPKWERRDCGCHEAGCGRSFHADDCGCACHNGEPKHSAKSPALQDLIEQLHDGPYLEMFAREQRLGWDTYGDQALNHLEAVSGL